MDVTPANFWDVLPYILECIERSRFVALDLEMNGLRHKHLSPEASFQEIYDNVRESAQKYSILQVGITCIWFDERNSRYTTRTFSIPLTPPFTRDLGLRARKLNRNIAFPTRFISLPRCQRLGIDRSVLQRGDACLSQEEKETLAWQLRSPQADDQKEIGTERERLSCRAFAGQTKKQVNHCVQRQEQNMAYEILWKNQYDGKLGGLQLTFNTPSEYANYYFWYELPTDGPYKKQAKHYMNQERDRGLTGMSIASALHQPLKTYITISGVRSIFEALLSQSKIDILSAAGHEEPHRPILVGHNLLYDLAFLHETLSYPLPARLDAFRRSMHCMFPRIVDTKYMFTRGKHSMLPDRTLSDLFGLYRSRDSPIVAGIGLGIHGISQEEILCGYHNRKSNAHDAGYDNKGWMTAVLFIKQTYHLFQRKGHVIHVTESVYPQPPPTEDNQGHCQDKTADSSSSLLDSDGLDDQSLKTMDCWTALTPTKLHQLPVEEMGSTSEDHRYQERASIPQWDDEFWKVFGNRTRMHGKGVLDFDMP